MAKINKDPITQLQVESETEFREALTALEQKGTLQQLPQLITFYLQLPIGFKRTAMHAFLASIIKKGIREAWMELLKNTVNEEEKHPIINILWNTRIDFSPYLVEFVQWAVEGDYQTTLECLTVIEQMAGPFGEELLLEAQCLLQERRNSHTESPQKRVLLEDIASVLKNFESHDELPLH